MAEVNLTEIATDLLGKAKQQGADGAEVMVADGQTLSVQVRMSAVECLTKAREKRLGLRVFVGHRSASSSTSDFSPESLDRVVADTCALAQAVAEDETSGLPDGDLLAKDIPDLDLWDETNLDTDTQIRLAKRAEEAALKADPRITNSEGADFHSSGGRVLLANSLGFQGEYRSSNFSVSVAPVASEKEGQGMQRDAWYAVHRKYAKLASPESVGREAARRALRRLGARKVSTTRAPVVFDQETAATLLAHLCGALSGYGLYKGASFLIDRLHTRVAPEFVTVYDDGRLPGGLGTRPFDGDGLPTRKNVVVDRGILTSYLLDTYSGRKLGMASTGNASRSVGDSPTVGPTNFYLQPGTTSPQDIIKSVTQGLYVTELIGFGVNMVTGDYSRGAAGLWIENGELAYPVEEITIAGNLKDIYADIELVGNDLEFRSRIVSPTLKIREMTIAGN